MNELTLQRLEYDQIKFRVKEYAMSYMGRQHVDNMKPITQLKAVRRSLDETEEALNILRNGSSVPIPALRGIDTILNLTGTGYMFGEEDFANLQTFLHSCAQLKKYMGAKKGIAPNVSLYVSSMHELSALQSEIERCVRNGRVTDEASKELSKLRKKIGVIEERLKSRLNAVMNRYRNILQESIISMRGDRYVLPVKKEHRKLLAGSILDESSSGQTVYIEPDEIAHLQLELRSLQADEAREEAKVLGRLSGLVEEVDPELRLNVEIVGVYDFLFAKARYALSIDGRNVTLNDAGRIDIRGARHPLLGSGMVPLDLSIGSGYRCLIITGPNTGGKTVALKTIGLLTLMVQSGLLVPVLPGSTFSVFSKTAADIGDGQSIEQSLSTFSAHVNNMIDILRDADRSTLALIDEMASGTDPGEGVGLSIAMLEELHRRGATVIVTTHYNEIKHFASQAPGFENARMEFDADTLRPLYRLTIGEAGQSYAFAIARNLGMPEGILRRSEELTKRRAGQGGGMLEGAPSEYGIDLAGEIEQREYGQQAREAGIKKDRCTEAGEEGGRRWRKVGDDQSFDDSQLADERLTTGSGTMRRRSGEERDDWARQGEPEAVRDAKAAPPGRLEVGDRVYISYLNRSGVVYREEDARGNVGVMIQDQKLMINKKRLSLHIPKAELYPDDYDLDIVFESKENRKKRHLMNRKHVEGLMIVRKPEDQ